MMRPVTGPPGAVWSRWRGGRAGVICNTDEAGGGFGDISNFRDGAVHGIGVQRRGLFIKAAARCFYGPSRTRAGGGVGIREVVVMPVSEPLPENRNNPAADALPPDRGRGDAPRPLDTVRREGGRDEWRVRGYENCGSGSVGKAVCVDSL